MRVDEVDDLSAPWRALLPVQGTGWLNKSWRDFFSNLLELPILRNSRADTVRPDKKAIVDEVWDDARIDGFLEKPPMGDGEDPDFSILLYAYRSMRVDDFQRFLPRFTAAGRDINARGRDGQTLREVLAGHRKGAPFMEVLDRAG